jgi:hypothetical protein
MQTSQTRALLAPLAVALAAACGGRVVVDHEPTPAGTTTTTGVATNAGAGGAGGSSTTSTGIDRHAVCQARCQWKWDWNCSNDNVPSCTHFCEEGLAELGPCADLAAAAFACEQPFLTAPCNQHDTPDACVEANREVGACMASWDAGS